MIQSGIGILVWLVAGLALLAAASALTWRSHRRWAARMRGPVQYALPLDGPATALDDHVLPLTQASPSQSGFLPLLRNHDAYAARVESLRLAGRSLDVMSYIWYNDLTGWLLIEELMRAADRGVRVRLLLDDVNVQGFDRTFLALNQHPNIEVRLFNPLRNRGHVIRRMMELMLGLARFNRRMHGKMWIADGRLAIIGGRNIGDTYFGATDGITRTSHDIDVGIVGPVVQDAERSFDMFWNLALSLPILTLWPKFRVSGRAFRRRIVRRNRRGASRLFLSHVRQGVLRRPFHFTDKAWFIADPPDKVYGHRTGEWMVDHFAGFFTSATRQVRIITPYFVPGDEGLEYLTGLPERGVQVQTLTNSLVATDNVIVYGAYARYRQALLKAGVEVFEYSPIPRADGRRDLLHTKLFIVDGCKALIGSVNFDLRSAYMNTELGVVVEDPALVAAMMAEFDAHISPDAAIRVLPDGHRHVFRVKRPGLPEKMSADPEAGPALRIAAWIVGHLPIRSWL
ncbi:phospholipase D-like domain-containing protein [Falsirhodobacter deserti]|uniref:phospholipase D-like domain-containing protein n=1 Tax=Falsirhodobacter deserti TaxID=1365611 RepID=UPI000FE385A7|nr:phosphatidylserine/phosphatidylglycerophosphate/cardiolipin synthase family protein [Falsirhodobacter deserti]